jgi:hypothetical protein
MEVSVSPRYGTWNRANLSVDTKVRAPSYLTLQSTAAAAPAN